MILTRINFQLLFVLCSDAYHALQADGSWHTMRMVVELVAVSVSDPSVHSVSALLDSSLVLRITAIDVNVRGYPIDFYQLIPAR